MAFLLLFAGWRPCIVGPLETSVKCLDHAGFRCPLFDFLNTAAVRAEGFF
jgi:hypothetical protein